jgi:protein transport protein SEC61 subunit gamma-like protein
MAIKDLPLKTKSFYVKCARVWQVLKKPTKEEFKITSKISAISIIILGVVGFIISLIVTAI